MIKYLFFILLITNSLFADFLHSNGIVKDSSTSLEWQDDINVTKTWTNAITYCEDLILNSKDDWRLPNRNELQNIVDYTLTNPAINSSFVNVVTEDYWSSTTYSTTTSEAWRVEFKEGVVYHNAKTLSKNVRCVRGSIIENQSPKISFLNVGYDKNTSLISGSPKILSSKDTNNAYDVVFSKDGKRAFIADYTSGLLVYDISDVTSPTLISSYASTYAQGVYLSQDEQLLALSDNAGKLRILNVQDLDNITQVYQLGETVQSIQAIIDRNNSVVYGVNSYDGAGIYSYDLSNGSQIASKSGSFGMDIDISEDENTVYYLDRDLGLFILNASDFAQISNIDVAANSWGVKISHDGKLAYITASEVLTIVNISNPTSPNIISTLTFGGSLKDAELSEDGKYLYVTEYNNGFYIVDVSNSTNPFLVDYVDAWSTSKLEVNYNRNLLIASNGGFGIIIADISKNIKLSKDFGSHNITLKLDDFNGDDLNISIDTNNSSLISIGSYTRDLLFSDYNNIELNISLNSQNKAIGTARIDFNISDGINNILESIYVHIEDDPLNKNLLLHYSFEDNTTKDSSLNHYDGNLSGDSNYTEGIVGNSLYFNGIDNAIKTPIYLNQTYGANINYTIAMWIKHIKDDTVNQTIFSTDNGGYDWQLYEENNYLYIFNGSNKYDTGITLKYNIWQHYTLTFDTVNNTVNLYIDGVNKYSNAISYDSSFDKLWIGRENYPDTKEYPLKGYIDDLRIYDRILDISEINNLKDLASKIDITLNFDNLNTNDHNISNIKLVNSYESYDLNISDLENSNISIINTEDSYSIQIDINNSNTIENWWYNFNDGKLYEINDGNSQLINSFTSDTNITIDAISLNWMSDTFTKINSAPIIKTSASQYLNIKNVISQNTAGAIAKSKDEQYLYTGHLDKLTIYDISNMSDIKEISSALYTTINTKDSYEIHLNNSETIAYIGRADGYVTFIDISNKNVPVEISTVDYGADITDMMLSNDESKLYIIDGVNLKVIDTNNNSEISSINVSGASRAALNKENTKINLLFESGDRIETFSVNSDNTFTSEHNITLNAPYDIEYSTNEKFLFVSSYYHFLSYKVNDDFSLSLAQNISLPEISGGRYYQDIIVKGNFLYAKHRTQYYHDVSIIKYDISNPYAMKEIETYPLPFHIGYNDIEIMDDEKTIFTNFSSYGLYILDTKVKNEKIFNISSTRSEISKDKKLIAVAKSDVVTLYDKDFNPYGTVSYTGSAKSIKFNDSNTKMVLATSTAFYIVNIVDKANPTIISTTSVGSTDMAYSDVYNHIYLVSGDNVYVYSIYEPTSPIKTGTLNIPSTGMGNIKLSQNQKLIYMASYWNNKGIEIVDVSNPFNPTLIGNLGGGATQMAHWVDIDEENGKAYLAIEYGLEQADISDPTNPTGRTNILSLSKGYSVKLSDDKTTLYLGNSGTNGSNEEIKILRQNSSGTWKLSGFINTENAESFIGAITNKYIVTSSGVFDNIDKISLNENFTEHNITLNFNDFDNSELNITVDTNTSSIITLNSIPTTITNFDSNYTLSLNSVLNKSGITRVEINATDGNITSTKYFDIIVNPHLYDFDINITDVNLTTSKIKTIELVDSDKNITISGISTLVDGNNNISFKVENINTTYELLINTVVGDTKYYNFTNDNFYYTIDGSDNFNINLGDTYTTKTINAKYLYPEVILNLENIDKNITSMSLLNENSTISFNKIWTDNLIVNGNAESSTNNWTVIEGDLATYNYSTNNAGENKSPIGENFFYGGNETPTTAYQDINLTNMLLNSPFNFSASIGGYSSYDTGEVTVTFINNNDVNISSITTETYTSSQDMTSFETIGLIPLNTVKARVTMQMIRNSGANNDGYIDDISFKSIESKNEFKYHAKDFIYGIDYELKLTSDDNNSWWYNFDNQTVHSIKTSSSFFSQIDTNINLDSVNFQNVLTHILLKSSSDNSNLKQDSTNNIIIDNVTDLIWQDNNHTKINILNHIEATTYCNNLSIGFYNNFRLPSIDELQTITDINNYYPAVKNIFTNILPKEYFTSVTNGSDIYVIDFANGKFSKVDNQTNLNVICVSNKVKYPFMKYILKDKDIDFNAIDFK